MGIKTQKTQRRAKSEILFYIYIRLCQPYFICINIF